MTSMTQHQTTPMRDSIPCPSQQVVSLLNRKSNVGSTQIISARRQKKNGILVQQSRDIKLYEEEDLSNERARTTTNPAQN